MIVHWMHVLHHGGFAAIAVGFALIVFVSYVPIMPIPVIATVMGAVLPLWPALLTSWVAATLGAVSKYYLERWFLQQHVMRWMGRYALWQQVVQFMKRNGFFAILVTRLIPFFPSAMINFAAAVTGIRGISFVTATALGKAPAMLTFTLAGRHLRHHVAVSIGILAIYLVIVGGIGWRLRTRWANAGELTSDPAHPSASAHASEPQNDPRSPQ